MPQLRRHQAFASLRSLGSAHDLQRRRRFLRSGFAIYLTIVVVVVVVGGVA
jgi:hypothetical protein